MCRCVFTLTYVKVMEDGSFHNYVEFTLVVLQSGMRLGLRSCALGLKLTTSLIDIRAMNFEQQA